MDLLAFHLRRFLNPSQLQRRASACYRSEADNGANALGVSWDCCKVFGWTSGNWSFTHKGIVLVTAILLTRALNYAAY